MPNGLLTYFRRRGGTFRPTQLTGLAAWYDAAQISGLSDGAAVTSWTDMSGNGYHATQATSTKQPTYRTNVANGKPVVRFDGGDGLVTGVIDYQSAGGATLFVVAKHTALTGDAMYAEMTTAFSSNNGAWIFYRQNATQGTYAGYKASTGTPIWQGQRKPSATRFTTMCLRVDASLPSSASFTVDQNVIVFQDGLREGGSNSAGNGNTTGTPTLANFAMYIGARNASNTFFNGDMAEMILYRRRLTVAERVQVTRYLRDKYALKHTHGTLVMIGDSMTAGTGATNPYPGQLDTLLVADGYDYNWGNYGRNGTQCTEIDAYATTDVDPLINMDSGRNVCVAWGGTNDLNFGSTVATTQTRYQTLCANRKAAGWKTIAVTMLPRSDGSNGAAFETARQTFNTWLRANYTSFADYLYDAAADTRIGDAGDELDTTYYQADRVHLNNTGLGIIAAGLEPIIQAIP